MSWAKYDALTAIAETGAVLIVRLPTAERAHGVARAAIAGGVRAVEITLSVPGALGVIRSLADEFRSSDVLIGAGTVLDEASAVASLDAGARLLVSPNLDEGMLRTASRYGAVTASGAFTPTEIVRTLEAGADLVKLFPTEIAGPDYVRAVSAPLPQAPIVPAGGVTVANVGDWFAAGAAAVGIGSSVTKAGGPDGDLRAVTAAAEEMLAAIDAARRE